MPAGALSRLTPTPTTQANRLAGSAKPSTSSPAHFAPSSHKIVRPFEPRGAGANVRRRRGRARRLRRIPSCGRFRLRTWIDQQSAGVEIAARRDPGSPAPTAAGVLLAGDDPEAAGVARERAAARLLVGGVDRVEAERAASRQRVAPPACSKQRLRRRHRRIGQRRRRENEHDDQQRRDRQHGAGDRTPGGRTPWPARRNTSA